MKIKVCGLGNAAGIEAVERIGADMAGMEFCPQSPRFVPMIRARAGIIPDYSAERLSGLSPESAADLPARGGNRIPRVGVFADDMPQNIITRVYNFKLDYVQLDGDEPRATCENLRRTLDPDIRPGIGVIKTIRVSCPGDLDRWRSYDGAVDMLLFDMRHPEGENGGLPADYTVLDSYEGNIPFLLGGDIGPESAERISRFHHPRCIGINVGPRFETAPGVMDIPLLESFIRTIRKG